MAGGVPRNKQCVFKNKIKMLKIKNININLKKIQATTGESASLHRRQNRHNRLEILQLSPTYRYILCNVTG